MLKCEELIQRASRLLWVLWLNPNSILCKGKHEKAALPPDQVSEPEESGEMRSYRHSRTCSLHTSLEGKSSKLHSFPCKLKTCTSVLERKFGVFANVGSVLALDA